MDFSILRKRLAIGKLLDDFMDKVSESGLLFRHGVDAYLKGNVESFRRKIEEIADTEHQGDALRRSLEEQLYLQTLIPESRGDVLDLLENMDALLDRFKGALWKFDIERPDIFSDIQDDFKELTDGVVESVEAIVLSTRAFFKELSAVKDHMHKVSYWESQTDKISTRLQRHIFNRTDLDLCQKMHLRDFVRHVDKIADRAEDVADKLSIYVIKRTL